MANKLRALFTLALSITLLSFEAQAEALKTPFKNLPAIAKAAGFDRYKGANSGRTVRIAVLDNGFRDYAKELGKTLPSNTVYHVGPVAVDAKTEESHGLVMAQIVAGLLNYTPQVTYELHLYSAFGYSNLEAAVNDVIAQRFDVVLYAQVWEYGGFGDGKGFINALVNRATSAGILWVNAAGNFADATYIARTEVVNDGWVKLPSPNDTVRVRCKAPKKKKCSLRAVLSWNDFNDDVNVGTDKDLDLIVTDDTLKIITSSALQQVKAGADQPGMSLYPREIANAEVAAGTYFLRVKARSTNFDKERDRLRLTVSGDHVQMLDRTEGSTVLSPGDNDSVITIGANDSEKSSSSGARKKPDLVFQSSVLLKNGEEYRGSSNSSAVAAAAVLLLKAVYPGLDRSQAIEKLSNGPVSYKGKLGKGLPVEMLGFYPTTSDGCFKPAELPFTPEPLKPFIKDGGTVIETTMGHKIFVNYDPIRRVKGMARFNVDDMFIANNNGYDLLPRSNQEYLPFGSFEIVEQPLNQIICEKNGTAIKVEGKGLALP